MSNAGCNVDRQLNEHEQLTWGLVSNAPVKNLWKFEGASARALFVSVWKDSIEDRLFGRAAELAFYFLFSMFPTLLCASSILGLTARPAHQIYDRLLNYLALVLPSSALGAVLTTFNEATAAASPGKITFGLIAAIWSASVGISACQGTLNTVYKVVDRRPYFMARLYAIGLTIVLIVTLSLCLASMFAGDLGAAWARSHIHEFFTSRSVSILVRLTGWTLASGFLALSFALTYYFAPDLRKRRWHWLTPGGVIGMVGWLLASLGFRVYVHSFNNYTVTYGSLGAVIILLMWFYITGLMLLLGAEINSEIEAAAVEAQFAAALKSPPESQANLRAA